MKLGFFTAICASLLLPLSLASGFSLDGNRWTMNRTVVMHLSLGGPQNLQDGSRSFNESAANALAAWNEHLVHMKFSAVQGSPLPADEFDDDNSVFFSATAYGDAFGSNTLALTFIARRGTTYTNADIIFNTRYNWDSYLGPRQPGLEDFQRVALHEFGHVLGLNHPDDAGQRVTALMNSRIGNLDRLAADDIAGARAIYDSGPPYLNGTPTANLVNLSTRAFIGTGEKVLIGGFIIQGSQPATIILRAIGNSLGARGITNPLRDPEMELVNASGTRIATNDDWIDSSDAVTIASYRLDPSSSTESAILRTLQPGNYTAIVKSFNNNDGRLTGTGLVELYNLGTTGGRAGNISARGEVLSGDDVLIAGFIIGGTEAKNVVVRAIGPSLAAANISRALPNPTLELRDASGNLVAFNDDWQTDPQANLVQNSGLAPTRAEESALHRTLAAGAYTAIVRGVNGTGIALVEVYDLAPVSN
ncbi:hypothetical protein BH20VER1_BH20VER1_26620 [soil metagenome]